MCPATNRYKNITKQTLTNYPFNLEAGEGHSLTVLGGLVALIARITQAGENEGRWGLKWIHYDRNVKPRNDTSAMIPLPAECENILAVAPLKGTGPDGESIVVVCPDRILRYYANASRVGEVMLDDDGDPRLNYNNKVVRAYPEPNQTQFVNCESAAQGNNNECDAACESLRIGCVSTHLSCAGCPSPIELPEAEYRFPEKEWLFSDPALGGFNRSFGRQCCPAVKTRQSPINSTCLSPFLPWSNHRSCLPISSWTSRAGSHCCSSWAHENRRGFFRPCIFSGRLSDDSTNWSAHSHKENENGVQAHMVFTEGGAAIDEQEYVSREVLTGSNVDQIQFSPFHNGRGDGGMLVASEPIDNNGPFSGRNYYAINTKESLGRVNLWSLAPMYTEERPVAQWYVSQSVGATYRLLQISGRPADAAIENGRLWTFSAIPTTCVESSQ